VTTDNDTPAKYDLKIVEGVILEIATELHPEHLSVSGLSMQIVGNPDDDREIETAAQAISNLRELGLFKDRDDEIVEPTPVMLHVVKLLIRPLRT
jgi:hypothetical protein